MDQRSPEQVSRYRDHQFAQTILDSISAHIAILDEQGYILETNRAWKTFAEENQIQVRPDTTQVNYLDVCENDKDYAFVAAGIRNVIEGKEKEFVMDYPCHSDTEKRWFYMRVTRASGPGPLRIVVSHENITTLKLAQEKLHLREEELFHEKLRMEEANTALKVILRQREEDRQDLEANVLDTVSQLIAPVVRQLKGLELEDRAKKLLSTLDYRLEQVTKPFLQRVASVEATLTPQEIEIAALIREGLLSKDIAERLNISITTVNFHRRNIREKLHLRNTRSNLRSYLISLIE